MLKLCIFADIHYIDKVPNWPVKRKLVEYADELTDKMINIINDEIHPDVVAYLGDLIQASNDLETDKKNIIHVWNKFKKIDYPYYTLLGNHELKLVKSNKEILDILGYKKASFSIDIKDYHLIFIGTDINEDDKPCRTNYISDEDLEWLKKDFEINGDKKIIIFSHFGIAEDKDIKSNYWCSTSDGENLMIRNRKELKRMMENKNILAVFCAHQHWTKTIKENGIDYYMIGSLIENINDDGIPDGVYFEVEIDDDKVNVVEKHVRLNN